MTKKEFFQAVRSYIEANAVEPRAGFRANVLKFQVGEYTLIVEHRQRGTGIVSVQHGYTYALIEQSMHPGKWSDYEAKQVLAAIALTPKAECTTCQRTSACLTDDPQAEDTITITEHPRSYRVTFPYKHNRYALAGFHEAGMIWKSPNNVGGKSDEVYWVIQTHKLTRALEVIGYWYGENPLPGQRRYKVEVKAAKVAPLQTKGD